MERNEMSAEALRYDDSMHRIGRLSMSIIFVALLCVPFAICLVFGEKPNFNAGYWAAFAGVLLQNIPGCFVEVITYAPILGTGGTYLAFITGNLSNLKIPCAMNARAMAKVEIGTKENEIVSTLSVATSSIVTTLTIILGVVLIVPLTPVLENPVLLPAFKTVIPALFGALGFTYVKKYPKIAVVPAVLAIVLFLLVPTLTNSVSLLVVLFAVIAMAYAFLLYKKGRV
ncbi:MAG: hypothetical protein VB021_01120 [Oscillospiraceae bacterium]|nr:hypothetical protein [Oscillospiraceae bacterium]